jgi:hypothetical protein
MTAQTNMELIQAWVAAVNQNYVRAELACWQPDGEFEVVATGTIYKGLAELERAGGVSASMVAGQPVQGRKQLRTSSLRRTGPASNTARTRPSPGRSR